MIAILFSVFAAQATAQAPTLTIAPPPAEEKVICKREPVTGWRTKFVKTCLTDREWRERRAENAKTLGDAVNRSAFSNSRN
ncbi:MAG TPA: hypothetical protein VGB70_01485 [Allosphingosinicella sp.]|jgi:hypothetical protein